MNREPIPSITLAYGTGDGQLLSVTLAHTVNGKNVAERTTARDIDAYAHTTVCNKPGIYLEIVTREGPDHNIPLPVWRMLFSLLRMQVYAAALIRNSSATEETEDLGSAPAPASNVKAILTTIPTGFPLESITINGSDIQKVLSNVMSPHKAQSIANDMCSGNASHGDLTILSKPAPSTYDPHYKDSDIPDDIHLYESNDEDNDLPF